jgi:hypothetical protein
LAFQDKFFVDNPLDVKENDEHATDFALQLSHLYWPAVNWHAIQTPMYGLCFLPRTPV